jgi:hypothetical protein
LYKLIQSNCQEKKTGGSELFTRKRLRCEEQKTKFNGDHARRQRPMSAATKARAGNRCHFYPVFMLVLASCEFSLSEDCERGARRDAKRTGVKLTQFSPRMGEKITAKKIEAAGR